LPANRHNTRTHTPPPTLGGQRRGQHGRGEGDHFLFGPSSGWVPPMFTRPPRRTTVRYSWSGTEVGEVRPAAPLGADREEEVAVQAAENSENHGWTIQGKRIYARPHGQHAPSTPEAPPPERQWKDDISRRREPIWHSRRARRHLRAGYRARDGTAAKWSPPEFQSGLKGF